MSAPQFKRVPELDGTAWLHQSGTMWIVRYAPIPNVRAAFFCAYKSVEKLPAGRMPWTVDNRRIGDKYPNLQAAKAEVLREVRS